MPANLAGLKYPFSRVLLPRTRIAYVHLRNLLTDAKRDRSARVSGYVAIWLPEDYVMLYLRAGEVVNATVVDGRGSRAIAIANALEMVPAEPEYGEICFHEAEEEQLACMYASLTRPAEEWPAGLAINDPAALFPYLMSTTFDGAVQIVAQDSVNYLIFKDGAVVRAFLSAGHHGTLVDRVAKLFGREAKLGASQLKHWPSPFILPVQAPPALLSAYRELAASLIERLVKEGRDSAPAIAEHARQNLVAEHPALEGFSFSGRAVVDPVVDTNGLTNAVATWTKEVMWTAADHDTMSPDALLRELTWERRHIFQSAGLFDQLPWKIV